MSRLLSPRPLPETSLADPVTELGTRARFLADLNALGTAGEHDGRRMVAVFELTGVDGYEREHGPNATGELLRRLAERLTDAVAGAGVAYRIGHTRFAVLVRVGRGGSQAIVLACAAALAEGHDGAGINAKPSTVIVPIELVNPADALLLLERAAADAGGQVAGSLSGQATLHTATGSFMEDRARAYGGPSEPVCTDTAAASAAMGAVTAGSAGSDLRERPRGGRGHDLTDHARVAPAPGDRTGPGPRTIADARRRVPPTSIQPPGRLPYMRISTRFKLSVLFGMLWVGLSAWLASPWIAQLANSITLPGAIALIAGLALIPGYLNAQLMVSLLLDHPKRIDPDFEFAYPALTVIVAAYDEQRKIAQTLAYALEQDYPGELNVILVDDGSHDETANIAWSFVRLDERLQVLQVAHGGKAAALNAGLRAASTSLVATIDADTLLTSILGQEVALRF
jgi:GGDEF domain-containing protein